MIYETSITAKNYSTALEMLFYEVAVAGLALENIVRSRLITGKWADTWIKPTEPIFKSADMVFEFQFKFPVTRKDDEA